MWHKQHSCVHMRDNRNCISVMPRVVLLYMFAGDKTVRWDDMLQKSVCIEVSCSVDIGSMHFSSRNHENKAMKTFTRAILIQFIIRLVLWRITILYTTGDLPTTNDYHLKANIHSYYLCQWRCKTEILQCGLILLQSA
jgi:hypothetical protein